jgi:hypothetical protein
VNVAAILGVGKSLGQRFTLVDLLPSALLGLFILALMWGGAPADAPSLDRFAARIDHLSGVKAVLLGLALVGFALITQPLQLALVRLLEGYWGLSRPAEALTKLGQRRHRRLREQLERRQLSTRTDADAPNQAARSYAAWALSRRYPPAPLIMPTRLGNALRAAEDRAGRRYGLDTVVAWPRLYPLLSERVRDLVDDQRAQLDIAARFTVTLLVAAVVSLALLVTHGWWLAVPAVGLALAWLSYRGACTAGIAYGESIETAFDLHRLDLRRALQLPLPQSLEQERALNDELTRFLQQPFAGRALVYVTDSPPLCDESRT